ncbi:hypothetical protein BT93_I0778 [Corymbia citriodora subsp. variegata]|nr:hypothetical protein BT93_I0778 [Corymbia citriodora subsp. variegata]
MELDLNKALLLSLLSFLALSSPCRAVTWPPGGNVSAVAVAPPPCVAGTAGCRIADLQPELEAVGDPGMLGASLVIAAGSALNPKSAGCGRKLPNGKYTPCTPDANEPPHCSQYCRIKCPC